MKSAQYGLVGRVPHTEGLSHSLVSWKINKTCQTHQEDSGELANNTLPLPILKHLHLLTDERGQLDNNPLLQSLDKQNNFTPTKNKSHSIWTSTKSYLNYSWSSIRGCTYICVNVLSAARLSVVCPTRLAVRYEVATIVTYQLSTCFLWCRGGRRRKSVPSPVLPYLTLP